MIIDNSSYERLKKLISDELRKSWEAQGHNMTGKVIDRLEWVSKEITDAWIVDLYMLNYGAIIDRGISPDKIPFSGVPGRARTSKYIEGLRKYAERRIGVEGKKALSIAFAIAYTHKKEGLPTRGSYKYSSTGERLDFASNVFDEKEDLITRELNNIFSKAFKLRIENKLTGIIKTFNQP